MHTTKVFQSGNSQAVRIPRAFQLDAEEVEIFRRHNELVIRKIPKNLKQAFQLLAEMPDDFMSDGRKDTPPQERKF